MYTKGPHKERKKGGNMYHNTFRDVAICLTWITGIPLIFLLIGAICDYYGERSDEHARRKE